MERTVVRIAFLLAAWLFVVSLLVQGFLAGVGIFEDDRYLTTHADFGYMVVHGLAIIMLVLVLFVPAGRALRWATAGNFILAFLMPGLATLSGRAGMLAGLHPVAAMALFWLAVVILTQARSLVPAPLGTAMNAPDETKA